MTGGDHLYAVGRKPVLRPLDSAWVQFGLGQPITIFLSFGLWFFWWLPHQLWPLLKIASFVVISWYHPAHQVPGAELWVEEMLSYWINQWMNESTNNWMNERKNGWGTSWLSHVIVSSRRAVEKSCSSGLHPRETSYGEKTDLISNPIFVLQAVSPRAGHATSLSFAFFCL